MPEQARSDTSNTSAGGPDPSSAADMTQAVPLSTVLGQLVVAHTIEVDHLFEQRMPHSTTVQPGTSGPWLISYAIWCNHLRHIDPAGTTVAELATRAAVPQGAMLNGLTRWGYATVGPQQPPGPGRKVPLAQHLVTLTAAGVQACRLFAPLPAEVEARWTMRFGAAVVASLRAALEPFVADVDPWLPHFLPVVGPELRTEVRLANPRAAAGSPAEDRDLLTLMAQTLLLFTLDHERAAPVSLPVHANVLRLLDQQHPVALKGLPLRAGVAKEIVGVVVGGLSRSGLVTTRGTGARAEVLLTLDGAAARAAGEHRLREVEQEWSRGSVGDVAALRSACEAVLAYGTGPGSPMAEGLRPPANGWRNHRSYRPQTEALLADPRGALPHHPMVLHRGGYPDGS